MNSEERYENEIPKHMPVDMAIAPDQKPYKHTYVIRTNTPQEPNKLAQHSLSPEKLGVVGYVRDVAGFVKDVVSDRREKKHQQQIERRNSTSSVNSVPEEPAKLEQQQQQQSQQQPRRNSFADVVTGLFPGVSTTTGCTHADELRSQMMQVNEQQELIHKHK
jgi:hypothetical protein